MLPLYFTLAAIFGYLLGSIPFGLVITKAAGLGDIRDIGSGNIGATNVLRTGRKDLALATLLLDAGKAGIALLIARALAGDDNPQQVAIGLTAGAAAFIGHCYPVWLKFKGGKGVATFFGVLFAGVWPLGVISGITWLAVATMFRISSLAALCAAAIAPIAALVAGFSWSEIIFSAALAILIFWRHSANIQRLATGTEPRIGDKKAASEPTAPAQEAVPTPVVVEAAPAPAPIIEAPPEPKPAVAAEPEPAPEPAPSAQPKPEA
ncbi:glycerol-3-phosphate 1-O-acyltransferase PlsY [Candidatus Viadribacter manganicus]|uniref:glycerol-3-phosphate 1-O-acyltransferase PlsY n=1 Tax=Candidatus Viadribacter manganicus TaxID=1759059 RepID=UPI000829DC00|nr:glycerol-3-phosphate 1-O-acyltransferase PlsY [Candidatus Viadribacter manganicus]